jgi:hypothetical protein
LNELEYFHEIQQGGNAIESGLDAILFNLVASTIPKFQTSEVDAKCAPVDMGP